MQRDEKEAEKYAMILLRYRERSKREMEERLKKKGFEESVVKKVVETLSQRGLLDDERFINMWIEEILVFRKKGKRAVFFELKKRGVNEQEIEKEWEKWREKEKEIAKKITEELKDMEVFEIKRKLYQKGFSQEAIEESLSWIQGL